MNKFFIILAFIFSFACTADPVNDAARIHILSLEIDVDQYEVSTRRFAEFVDATSYITTADSLGWSAIFSEKTRNWIPVDSVTWRNASGIPTNELIPVTQVSYSDACAFCQWAGGRLPTAEEWDVIAGTEVIKGNTWDGIFPILDEGNDGFAMCAAPIGQFEPNAYGIHDLFGNVWEWTTTVANDSMMVIKGGSFLCAPNYCSGFIPEEYQKTPKNSGLNHLGFRCVYSR